MTLAQHVNTFGQALLRRYGERVHKVAIDAGFTCPNRDGTLGRGGCAFCNNASFSPNEREPRSVAEQIAAGRAVIRRRTGALRYIAYFQAYTNTYGVLEHLDRLYREALAEPDVVGLAVGTRPDCLEDGVLDLLAGYRDEGREIWIELGLQSAFDETLRCVRRGHGFAEYRAAAQAIHSRGLALCTHLIVGLPGESPWHARTSLERVLELGVDGLKVHPLHVVRGTRLAVEWRRGAYRPLTLEEYVQTACDIVEATPPEVEFHRLTGTAPRSVLLAPEWCAWKWRVLNAIEAELARRESAGVAGQVATAGAVGRIPLSR